MALITRREFTAGLAAVAAGLAARAEPREAGALGLRRHRGRVRAIPSAPRPRPHDRGLTSVGLTSVELWNGHLDPTKATEADFKAVRGKLDAAGIKVSAYCANFPTDATDDHLERAFRGAGLLGTDVMTSSLEKPILDRLDERCRSTRSASASTTTTWATPGSRATRRRTSRARTTS